MRSDAHEFAARLLNRLPNMHPNGFWVFLLKSFENGLRLRIHYWPRGATRLKTPHDHRSWFVSLPLWGLFREVRYAEVEGSAFRVINCASTTSNGRAITTEAGRGNLTPISTHHRIPFVPYFCGVGVIHSLQPVFDGPAVSLVLFGRHRRRPKAWL